MSDISEEDKDMVLKMVGTKIGAELEKTMKMVEEKNKTSQAKYELTQHKLDTILDYLKRIEAKN